ncbi:MAG: TonB-dependent receptor [Bacteroidota bacterium]
MWHFSFDIRRILPLGAKAFLLSIPLQAQDQSLPVTVSGTVTEAKSGEALLGFHVLAFRDTLGHEDQFLRGVATNKQGYYSLQQLPPGRYIIRVSGVGYGTLVDTLLLFGTEKNIWHSFSLSQTDIRLEEVVVESRRDPVPTRAISTIAVRPDFIRQMPALGGEADVFRSLQLLPGVKAVSEISSGLYVRGGSHDQNLTLLDGVAIHNPSHLGGFLSAFHADALKDVRIMKGVFPAEYGGRLSSIIDLDSKDGSREKLGGTAGVSLINSRFMLEGPLGESASFMVAGRRVYLDLLVSLFLKTDEVPLYYFYDLNARVNFALSPSDRLTFSGFFGRDVLDEPADSRRSFELFWGNSGGTIRWTHLASPTLFLNTSVTYSNYRFFVDLSEFGNALTGFTSVSDLRDVIVRANVEYFPHEDHRIKAGMEVVDHSIKASHLDIIDAPGFSKEPPARKFRIAELGAFVQDEWNLSNAFSLNLGGRVTYFQSGRFLRVEPRLLGSYALTPESKIKGAYARVHQFLHQVSRYELALPSDVWFPATSVVRPGRSDMIMLGFETTLSERAYVITAEVYYRKMANLFEFKEGVELRDVGEFESAVSKGTGDAYGFELLLQKQTGAMTGWVSYTLASTKRTFPDINRGRTFFPRHDRLHDISLALTYRLSEGWEFGVTWMFASGQPYTMPSAQYAWDGYPQLLYSDRNNYRLAAFHKLDLAFIRRFSFFGLPAEFSINIYNAYASLNPFTQIITFKSLYDGQTDTFQWEPVVQQITLFPIIPTFGLSVTF